MEQRAYPRIQIPLLVELTHPAIGTIETTARDVSEGGLFVHLPHAKIKLGGKLKLRLLTVLPTDTQPTPTVEMDVKRITDDGLGLAFTNRTAKHLWQSVQQLRAELEIGRDYFQVYQSLAITHDLKGLLLVQQNGKWLLPGLYLIVGQHPIDILRNFAKEQLDVDLPKQISAYSTSTTVEPALSEAATYNVIYRTNLSEHKVKLSSDTAYKDWRWITKTRDLREITFASATQRKLTEEIIGQHQELV